MTKIEKVRQYMEITGTGDNLSMSLRNFIHQLIPSLAKAARLNEQDVTELMKEIDARLLLMMPNFISACAQALADTSRMRKAW